MPVRDTNDVQDSNSELYDTERSIVEDILSPQKNISTSLFQPA
jgi:hypothetical protein